MKTRYLIILTISMLSVCCTRVSPDMDVQNDILHGVMDADVMVTKSILVDNPGVKLESFWEAGDQIGVFGSSASNVLFTLQEGDLSADRKSADFRSDGTIPSGDLTAYAPYQQSSRKEGNALLVTFPSRQRYVTYNGVVQPDPSANILLGEGNKSAGLVFRNMTAVLKIGQVFEEETLVKAVEFRDLSGAPVAGAMRLTGGNSLNAEIVGEEKVLTLDLGEGVEFSAGAMHPLFLIVPPRSYAAGFEITFIDNKGNRTVKTVGTAMGKTLMRGVVYLIGDISGNEYPAESSTVLMDGATIMTSEALDKVMLTVVDEEWLRDENGDVILNEYNYPVTRPVLNLIVHKDLHPDVGNWLIFEQSTATLPEGGVYKITSSQKVSDDRYQVEAHFEPNFAAPYKEMTAGAPIYDEAGNYLGDGGIELDLASHLAEIRDAEGNSIPFSVSSDGRILFSEEATEALLNPQPETKAVKSKTFSFPKAFFKHSEKNAEVSFAAQMQLKTRFSACFADGEVQYIHFVMEPEFTLSADFVLKAEFNIGQPFHLMNLIFTPPFMIAPGVILTVNIDLSGEVGVGGNVQFSTSVNYNYNAGRYGLSYNIGQGFSARYQKVEAAPTEIQPSLGGASASIYAYGKLNVAPHLSLYGMLGLGVQTSFGLKFGASYEETTQSRKLALTPELELIPSIAVLGGRFSKTFKDLTTNIEFDPIWEQYLSPKVNLASGGPRSIPLSKKFYIFEDLNYEAGSSGTVMQVPVSPKEWSYHVELEEQTPIDYSVELRVYESNGKVDEASLFSWSDPPQGWDSPTFESYLAAGIPHMYPFLNYIRNPDYMPSPRLVLSHTVGSYSAGMERANFEGIYETSTRVTSGHLYWTRVFLVSSDGGEIQISPNSSGSWVYYWPEDFWGRSYKEEE